MSTVARARLRLMEITPQIAASDPRLFRTRQNIANARMVLRSAESQYGRADRAVAELQQLCNEIEDDSAKRSCQSMHRTAKHRLAVAKSHIITAEEFIEKAEGDLEAFELFGQESDIQLSRQNSIKAVDHARRAQDAIDECFETLDDALERFGPHIPWS